MEQKEECRNKPMPLWSVDKGAKVLRGEGIVSSVNGVGKTGQPHARK